ncbi:MAG: iron chelate uptake ABC transporter family permease subunit, partial [Burkholderiaceae bacterium]
TAATSSSISDGAAALVLADLVARTIVAPIQLPVGVVTALIGVPVFLFILSRRT